ncbi:nodulation protein NodZ [Diplocloster agilis]|uniref:Alpha-(1,6)-fucosyltransferase N- and catalytic domain-containing protein n=1 Tax=Diplocloster agilis TaxID=2850323 RepID=A0A949JXG2_9FIRM|nr:nodulation protein NodZ [Diplocloster agilis]MBU9735537.1 hypothetical protein [Diplocloster agilis]
MNRHDFLIKHPKLDYLQQCLRHFNDREFVDVVNAINRDPNLLYFVANGNLYPNILFYDIYMDYPSKGFFALFIQTLDALRYAERFHLVPVVTWSDRCLYKAEQPINGTNNPFCYYFEAVSEFDRDEIAKAMRVLKYKDAQRALDKEHPFGVVSKTIIENDCYEEYINENALVYKKYIKMKKTVQQRLDRCLTEIAFEGKVLGVHVRATDFNKGYVNHAMAVDSNEYMDHVIQALAVQHFDRIFLATDDAFVVEKFQLKFGSKVIFCKDVCRSSDGMAVHFGNKDGKNHKYQLGLEVIRDMYILSCCTGLIGGFSNVCIMAQIAKKSYGCEYEYLDIINKGFNTVGKTTYQDHYK